MLKPLTISAFASVLLLTPSVQAIQLSITPGYAYGSGNAGVSLTYKSDTGFHNTYNSYVGELITREVDTKGVPVKNSAYPNGFVTFCVDVAKTINWSPANYSYTETAFANINASFMNPDWNEADKIQVAKTISSVYEEYTTIRGLSYTQSQLNVAATAAQLAIWEVISDYDKSAPIDYNLKSGNFMVNNNTLSGSIKIGSVDYNPLSLAEHWAETASANNTYNSTIFMGGSGTSPQSLLYPQSSSTPPTAPDGGTTMLLMGLGMLGLEGLRRKIQK